MALKDSIRKLSQSLGIGGKPKDEPESSDGYSSEELDLERLQESDSDSNLDSSAEDEGDSSDKDANGPDEEEQDEEEQEDIPLSDAELDDDADVVPHQKMTINNQPALRRCLKSIQLPESARSQFVEHLSITAGKEIELRDIYDDTERELAFYKQALEAAIDGRKNARKANIPFSRPTDFFAEMLKSDEHMAKVKTRLMDQEQQKKASQEARKQRELKKYGKKVQNERLQQRAKEKRETLDKIQGLKRKRKNADMDNDQFDVEIEDALSDKKQARDNKYKLGNQNSNKKQPNRKRLAKNTKYGSGHKRGERKNTAESSMDVSSFRNKRRR